MLGENYVKSSSMNIPSINFVTGGLSRNPACEVKSDSQENSGPESGFNIYRDNYTKFLYIITQAEK